MSDYTEDPYAGGGAGPKRNASSGEVRTELQQFTQRLRDLGATPDEVDPVLATWDDLDADDATADEGEAPPWTAARRTALVNAPDAELLGLILAARDEYTYATTTEGEAADAERQAQLAAVAADAAGVIGRSVGDVLAWVGTDADRATAVLALETAEGAGANRKTLVGPLQEQVAEAAAAQLVDANGAPVDLPDGGDPRTAEPEPLASAPAGTLPPAPEAQASLGVTEPEGTALAEGGHVPAQEGPEVAPGGAGTPEAPAAEPGPPAPAGGPPGTDASTE